MEWISTEEMLPPMLERVLVVWPKEKEAQIAFLGLDRCWQNISQVVRVLSNTGTVASTTVKWWMPLQPIPKKPRKKKGDKQ